jgi:multicomponent K+:H+ antiporter subunit A
VRLTRAVTEGMHNGAISRYLAIFVVASVALGYVAWRAAALAPTTRGLMPVPPVVAAGWVLLVGGHAVGRLPPPAGSRRWC